MNAPPVSRLELLSAAAALQNSHPAVAQMLSICAFAAGPQPTVPQHQIEAALDQIQRIALDLAEKANQPRDSASTLGFLQLPKRPMPLI